MALTRAARVGDGIAHVSVNLLAVGIGVGVGVGLLIVAGAAGGAGGVIAGGVLIVSRAVSAVRALASIEWSAVTFGRLFSPATSQAIALPMARTNVVTTLGTIGRRIAGVFQTDNPRAGVILDGCATVFIGAAPRRAAFRSSRARVSCHGAGFVAQGSESVFYESFNASRVGDGTSCAGTVSEGDATVFVGGEPSGLGAGPDRAPLWYRLLSGGLDLADFISGIPHEWMRGGRLLDAWRNYVDAALWVGRRSAELAGYPRTASLLESVRQGIKGTRFRNGELDELRRRLAIIKSGQAAPGALP